MKANHIKITVDRESPGKTVFTEEECFLQSMNGDCIPDDLGSGGGRECLYGLTDVAVPEWCPLRHGPITIEMV